MLFDSMDEWIKHINLQKTIKEFGYPKLSTSQVYISCICGKESLQQIKHVKRKIKIHGNHRCASCRLSEVQRDPEYRKRSSERLKKIWKDNQDLKDLQSKKSKELWQNPEYKKRRAESLNAIIQNDKYKENQKEGCKNTWKRDEFAEKIKASSKQNWENPEYRRKQKEIRNTEKYKKQEKQNAIKVWEREEYRKKASNNSKKLWQNPNYLNNSKKYKEEVAKKSKELWQDPEYKEKVTNGVKRIWKNEEKRAQSSIKIKQLWENTTYREKQAQNQSNHDYKINMSNKIKQLWENDEYRSNISSKIKKIWQNQKYRSIQAQAQTDFLKSGKDSIIERVTQQILDQLGVPFERQKVIGPYSFDLSIPSHNLLIECQGGYWHSLPKAKKIDSAKFTYVDKYHNNLRLIYLYERDFLNPGLIKQKLIRELFDSEFSEEQIDFKLSYLKIKSLSVKKKLPNSYYSAPEEFLQSFHYAGFGRAAKLIFGAYLNNELIAVCKFAPVIRKEVATSLCLKCNQVLELDRFCIHPQYQKKNLASWFIAKCTKLINDPKITHLVSFADSTFGHSGTIYKAANWTEIGKIKPSYHYINKDGWVLHKKTLWGHAKSMKKSEQTYAEEFGYQKIQGKEKTKFIFTLD